VVQTNHSQTFKVSKKTSSCNGYKGIEVKCYDSGFTKQLVVELVSVTNKEGMVLPHFPLQQEHVQFGEYSGIMMNAANNPKNYTLDPITGRLASEGAREPTYGEDEYSESEYSTTTGRSTISSKKTIMKKQRTSGTSSGSITDSIRHYIDRSLGTRGATRGSTSERSVGSFQNSTRSMGTTGSIGSGTRTGSRTGNDNRSTHSSGSNRTRGSGSHHSVHSSVSNRSSISHRTSTSTSHHSNHSRGSIRSSNSVQSHRSNQSTSVGGNNSAVIDLDEEEEHNVGELTLYLPVNRET
jgi:hypothetical protein